MDIQAGVTGCSQPGLTGMQRHPHAHTLSAWPGVLVKAVLCFHYCLDCLEGRSERAEHFAIRQLLEIIRAERCLPGPIKQLVDADRRLADEGTF